ncbi:hypothetical protein [Lutibacter sp. B1]|uniref:hypothetical protein n=1 Tax=Lutibacter sp. B1 TaxID=2725996 RepID=UPI00145743BD|nr:hypothetical protein [Lutibacter sp. B1]NLP57685.1 hypothetical protein [Lutibacter sp. B1]
MDIVLVGFLGLLFFLTGLLNLFYGNDFGLGVFFIFLSFIYLLPINKFLKNKFGFSIHYSLKIVLALFIIWVTLAVGAIAEGYVF